MGRARPRTAQNPAERLGDDDDDMDVDNADVAGPSGLHSEFLTALRMSRLMCFQHYDGTSLHDTRAQDSRHFAEPDD